jgi:hypothetical protein
VTVEVTVEVTVHNPYVPSITGKVTDTDTLGVKMPKKCFFFWEASQRSFFDFCGDRGSFGSQLLKS